jgi:hypothetical protein
VGCTWWSRRVLTLFLTIFGVVDLLTRVIATPTDYSDKAFHKGYSTKVPLNSEITVYFTLYHI